MASQAEAEAEEIRRMVTKDAWPAIVKSIPFTSQGINREVNWNLGGAKSRLLVLADASQTGNAMTLAEHSWPAGYVGRLHSHGLEDEGFYVLEGEVTVNMPDFAESYTADPGEFVWHPRGGRHTYSVGEAGPARVLQFLMPGTALVPGFFSDIEHGRFGDLSQPGALETMAKTVLEEYSLSFYPPGAANERITDGVVREGGVAPEDSTVRESPEAPPGGDAFIPWQPLCNRPFKSDRSAQHRLEVGRGMMTNVHIIAHAFGHQTGNVFGMVEIDWGPGDLAGPHVHTLEDEGFYVLEGELTMYVAGSEPIAAKAGDFVWAARGCPHYYHVTGKNGARVLVFEVPGGSLTDFFYRAAVEQRGADIESDEGLAEFLRWTRDGFGIHFFDPAEYPGVFPELAWSQP